MDELFVWLVIGVIIGLIIVYIAARSFGKIAEMKGHDGKTYFWWVFWLGIFGMMMVIALPDRNQTVSTVSLSDENREGHFAICGSLARACVCAAVGRTAQPVRRETQ